MDERKLKSCLEAILLVSFKPLSVAKLAELIEVKPAEIEAILPQLSAEYEEQERGFRLIINNRQVQLVSSPEWSAVVKAYLKDDITGELTEPSLETLTIIAYRQPIAKSELEQIRGVNCSLILRNLLIRGLVEAEYEKEKGLTLYSVTTDFLKFLGLSNVAELPNFIELNSDENLRKLLENTEPATEAKEDTVYKVAVTKE